MQQQLQVGVEQLPRERRGAGGSLTPLSRREGLWRLLELSRKPIFIVFESQYREIAHPAITLLKQHRSAVTLLVWRAGSMVSAEQDCDPPPGTPFPSPAPHSASLPAALGGCPMARAEQDPSHQHGPSIPSSPFCAGLPAVAPAGAAPRAPVLKSRLGHSPFRGNLKTQPAEPWLWELTPQTCTVRSP